MCLVRALVLSVWLAASSAGCIAGPQPEPPTGGDQDAAGGAPRNDAAPGGGSDGGAVAYDAGTDAGGARDAGPALDSGSQGPIVIPPKPVDQPPRPVIGPGPLPSLVDGSHAAVDGGVTAP